MSPAESIDSIRKCRFRVISDSLRGGVLEKWLNGSDEPRSYGRLAALEDTVDVFRLENASGPDYLLFKVFAYAYALHRDLWVLPQFENDTDKTVGMQFRQFRRLLEPVAETRKVGADIGSYNLLDFKNYDELLKKMRLDATIQ